MRTFSSLSKVEEMTIEWLAVTFAPEIVLHCVADLRTWTNVMQQPGRIWAKLAPLYAADPTRYRRRARVDDGDPARAVDGRRISQALEELDSAPHCRNFLASRSRQTKSTKDSSPKLRPPGFDSTPFAASASKTSQRTGAVLKTVLPTSFKRVPANEII